MEFSESDKSLKHELGQFKDPYLLLPTINTIYVDTVLCLRSFTQEVIGSNNLVKYKYFVTEFIGFNENIKRKRK